MADYGSALAQFWNRVSEEDRTPGTPGDAIWYLLTRSEVRFSKKDGPRPYLCLQADEVGTAVVYPRTTLKGDIPTGDHYPDQPYPFGVLHKAHAQTGHRCDLTKDATVLASEPRSVGAYVLRGRRGHCVELDQAWLSLFSSALTAVKSNVVDRKVADDGR